MTKNEITFEGETWAQMSKSRRIASLKFCMEHIFDKHGIHNKWICRWLVLYIPEIDQRQWRKLLKPLREKIAMDQIELDLPKIKDSHVLTGLTMGSFDMKKKLPEVTQSDIDNAMIKLIK